MRKLMRYWETNKKKILTIIGLLAFIIFIVHFMNAIIADSIEKTKNENSFSTQTNEEIGPTKSIIDDSKISTQTAQENTQMIKQFVEHCNQKNYQNAFNLLSSSCQKEIFNNDVNVFKQDYVDKIFDTDKTYNAELWTTGDKNYIYQIKYYEDNLLATGGKNTNINTEDYITIVKENGENRLNIKNFIFYEEINKTVTKADVEIIIHNRKVYKTYESYDITVKNNTANTISVSLANNEEDIFLVDENGAKYNSMLYEIPQYFLNVKSRYQTNINLSFNKAYNVYRKTESMRFQGIVLNYEEYANNSYKDLEKVTIDIKI